MKKNSDEFAAALRAAVAALARRPMTRREVSDFLERREHAPEIIGRVTTHLERQSLLSDRAAAEAIAHTQLRKGSASGEIRRRMLNRGVPPDVAANVSRQATEGRDDASEALRLARVRVRACPPTLSPEAIRRRVFAWLARRGYDDETCRSAVERATKEITPD